MKQFLITIALAATALSSWAITATEAFTTAPNTVFPLLEKNTRLDMVDYFNSGLASASSNKLDGKTSITLLSDSDIRFTMSSSSAYQIAILPSKDGDIIALIETVATPAPDSNISFYTDQWSSIDKPLFNETGVSDWLTADGRDNSSMVESLVPFMLVSYNYDPATKSLILRNNVKPFLGEEMYSMIDGYLCDTLVYTWNGKRFELKK